MERYRVVILAALFIGIAVLVWLWSSSTTSIEPVATDTTPVLTAPPDVSPYPESQAPAPRPDAPPPRLPTAEPAKPNLAQPEPEPLPAPLPARRDKRPDPGNAVVSGVVTLEGQPASRLAVGVEFVEADGSTRGVPGDGGRSGVYSIETPPGNVRILFEVVNEKGQHLTHVETLSVASGRTYQLDYDFPAAGILRGQVTGIGEYEYAGLLVLLGEYSIEANAPEDIYALADEADGEMTVRGDGNYVLDDLEPGRYTVVVITRLLDEQQIREHDYEFRYVTGYVDVQSGQEAEFNVAFE